MKYWDWQEVFPGDPTAELFRWVPRIEQLEMFPQSAELARPGTDGYLDTRVSVSALPDGRTLYAF